MNHEKTSTYHRDKIPEELWNIWQNLAELTNDVITPANLLGITALGGEIGINQGLILGGHQMMQNPTSDKEFITGGYQKIIGLILDQPLLLADFIDGKVARATGTVSRLGEVVDFMGDGLKAIIKLRTRYQISEMSMRDIIAIAGPKVVNGVTSGVRTMLGEQVTPTLLAKLGEWPRGLALLVCDIVEIMETLYQVQMVEGGRSAYTVQRRKHTTPEIETAREWRDGLLLGALAVGSLASIENILAMLTTLRKRK